MGHFSVGRLERCFYCVGKIIEMLSDFGKYHGHNYLIPEVLKLAKSLLVFPGTKAICECSFSTIKHNEIFLRNTMHLEIGSTIVSCSMHIAKSRLVQLDRSGCGFQRWYSGKITNFWDILEKRVISIILNRITKNCKIP